MQWLGVETARCDNHLGGRTQFVLFFARRARRYFASCRLLAQEILKALP